MSTTVADLKKRQKTPMNEIMKQPPKQRVMTLIEEHKDQLAAALPRHLSVDRLANVMLTAATSNPQLLECYTPSLFGCMIKSSQLGLEPNNALGQSYIIPFRNKKANRTDAQIIIGYRGMIDLARRSGHVVSLQAQAVREGDTFEFEWGTEEKLRHIPGSGDRGAITHFYSYAKLKDGGVQFDVLTKADVDAIMRATQSRGEYGPWRDHYEQMGRKTLIRRLFNYLPVSIEMAEAMVLDSTGDTREQHMENVLDNVEYQVMDQAPSEPEPEPLVDVNGEIFDPELHASDDDGEPIYNKDQSFRKRPQRKAAVKPTAEEEQEQEQEEEPAGDDEMFPPDDDYGLE